MSFEGSLKDAELEAPHHHRLVLGSGDEQLAVRRKMDARNDSGVAVKGARQFRRVEQPDLQATLDGDSCHGGVARDIEAADRMIVRVQIEAVRRHQLLSILALLLLLRIIINNGVLVAKRVERNLIATCCYQIIVLRHHEHSSHRTGIGRHGSNYFAGAHVEYQSLGVLASDDCALAVGRNAKRQDLTNSKGKFN